jgi:hypothetical protein
MARFKRGAKRGVLLTLLVVVLGSFVAPGQSLASPVVDASILASSGHGSSVHRDRPYDGQGDSPLVP